MERHVAKGILDPLLFSDIDSSDQDLRRDRLGLQHVDHPFDPDQPAIAAHQLHGLAVTLLVPTTKRAQRLFVAIISSGGNIVRR